jgi:hypothetical protein
MEATNKWWMKIVSTVAIAALTGYASFLFGQFTMKSQLLSDQRASAYVQFVESRAKMREIIFNYRRKAGAQKRQENGESQEINNAPDYMSDKEYIDAKALHDSARYRMIIFGGKKLTKTLSEYLRRKEDNKLAVELFQAMRSDLLPNDEQVQDEVIRSGLFPSAD